MVTHYYQVKTLINFWCRQGLNLQSLIQPSETLPVELIEICHLVLHICYIVNNPLIKYEFFYPFFFLNVKFNNYGNSFTKKKIYIW